MSFLFLAIPLTILFICGACLVVASLQQSPAKWQSAQSA